MTTIARSAAITNEIGRMKCAAAADAATRTTSPDSVAYATEESGSEAKTGSASFFDRSVSSSSALARGRPTTSRLSASTCIDGDASAVPQKAAALSEVLKTPRAYACVVLRPVLSLGAVAVVSLGVFALEPVAPVLSLGVLYLFAVLPVAGLWGLRYAVPVSVVSMLAFNWFFLPPTHTFQLHDSENWVALAVYLVTAVSVSGLATRGRRLERKDVAKTAVLRSVSHDLRSPITAILTASEVAAGDVSDAERDELLAAIRVQARRRGRRRASAEGVSGRAGGRDADRARARQPARERARGLAGLRRGPRGAAERRGRRSRRRPRPRHRGERAAGDLRTVQRRGAGDRTRARDRAGLPAGERRPALGRVGGGARRVVRVRPARGAGAGVTARVLVVDDEPQILRALQMKLHGAGYTVDTAATASDALAQAAMRPPEAVILDLLLPDGSGTDVCRELRTWTQAPSCSRACAPRCAARRRPPIR